MNAVKSLSANITSYDLLKTFAVLTMVIDHVGAYFFPDYLWIRVIGRMSFPVWLFLIGYARSRDISPRLLIGAGVLIISDFILGMPIFMLNILVTIALVRVLIDRVAEASLRDEQRNIWRIAALMFLMIIPTALIFDYGTQALITAMFGYCLRRKEDLSDDKIVGQYMLLALLSFILVQQVMFGFSTEQFWLLAVCTGLVYVGLYYFKPLELPELTAKCPSFLVWFLQFCGRRTLEIYVVHLLLFKALGVYLGIVGAGLFTLHLFAPS